MRILFLTGEFPPLQGGVGDCTDEIARALARLGVEAHVLTRSAPGCPADTTENGVLIHRVVKGWGWGVVRIVQQWIRSTRADIAHIQYQTAAFGMHPAVNFTPRLLHGETKFVTTFHDLKVPYLFPKAGAVRDWVTFAMGSSSAAVVATNDDDYSRLAGKDHHVSLIPIGSNIASAPPPGYDRDAWREKLGIGKDTLLLSYFGFLNESKGGETLMRALALVPSARLIMIGGQVGASDPTNTAYLAHVKSLIEELGIGSRVLWTDYIPPPEVSADLLASDLCVLPFKDGASFRRGSMMAAIAHGLPILSTTPPTGSNTREGPLPRLVHGDNIWLVPPDSPQALAGAIQFLAVSLDRRAVLGRGALELAGFFTWDKIAAQHLALYEALIRGAPTR